MDFSPLWISLKTAFLATIITSIIGIFISYKMANYKGRGRGLIDGVFTLPLILPPTVIGFFLLLICGKNGFVGKIFMSFNKNIIFSWSATVIAATVVAFPMMYRTCRSAFEQIDKNMISAARTLGLSETKIFFKIAIPLAWPGIIGGLVLSFARALGEFGATLINFPFVSINSIQLNIIFKRLAFSAGRFSYFPILPKQKCAISLQILFIYIQIEKTHIFLSVQFYGQLI